jgi:hypothetical protein
MNTSTTASHVHPAVFFVIGLLCLCVAMEILGAPISRWNIYQSVDLLESSPLEELSLPSTVPDCRYPNTGSFILRHHLSNTTFCSRSLSSILRFLTPNR